MTGRLCLLSLVAALELFLAACSPGNNISSLADDGSLDLALTTAPSDLGCLRVTAEGSRSSTHLFDLTPGVSTVFRISRLPVGRVILDAQGFSVACSRLSSFQGDPLYVTEAPIPVRIDPIDVVSVSLKLIRNGRVTVSVDFEPSPSSYLVPRAPGVVFKDLITTGDSINGYKMAGIPDGLGAFDNGNGTFTVLMNHELPANAGVPRAHGARGAFVSKWIIRKSDLTVLWGEDLIRNVIVWNRSTSRYAASSEPVAFGRFCSADLPPISAWYDAATGTGFNGRLYTNGEEIGAEGRAWAHALDGTSWELPRLGKMSFENVVANPDTGSQTLVATLDDSTPGQVYFYLGSKTSSGTPVQRAGLTNGTLYGVKVEGVFTEDFELGIPSGTPFALVDLGNVENMTGAQLEEASNAAGISRFNRPEDGAWDPQNPSHFYFVTTASFNAPSRLYRLRFIDIKNVALGGQIDMLLDGTEGGKMFDNIAIDRSGHVILLEDVGNNPHLGKVWRYDIANQTLTQLAEHDPLRFLSGGPEFLTQDEESSGVIDLAGILGPGWYLLDVQAHYPTDAETVEGGQLIAMYAPSWLDTSLSTVDLAIIGDTPYGPIQIEDFPNLIADMNAAPGIRNAVHLGDIKNGSSRCDD